MRIAVGVGAWLLGVGAATGGSLLAVSLLGQGIAPNNSQQLTQAAVSRALASEVSEASSPGQVPASTPIATPSPARSSRIRPTATPPPQTEVTPSGRPASADPTSSPRPHPSGGKSATPTPTPTPTPASTPTTQAPTVLTSQGGSVLAECLPAGAYLLSWSPTQGYEAGQVVRGPASTAQVTFEGHVNNVTMVVSCSTGVPTATTTVNGGGGGGGGGGDE